MANPRRIPVPWLAGLLATALLCACGSTGPLVADRLDELTGVTVTRATKPLVLYRDRSAQAAFARDFVYLGPVEVNNMGRRQYFVWLGIWSTTDSASSAADIGDLDTVVIYADGEPLRLDLAGLTPDSIGVSEPVYVKPVASSMDAYYRVTTDQIRVIAEARDIELMTGAARPQRFLPWDNTSTAMESLRAFLRRVE
ncbi:MAG TPA: hypothetical protein VIS31_15510 [Woeseiaceae bacterium]